MIDLLQSHASVRKYTEEVISDEIFHELIIAAQHVASSNFVQAYSVIQITDPIKKEKLGELSKNELQFGTAAKSLVFCADLRRLEMAANMHGETIESGTVENFTVATIDTALFAQNFVVAAESKGYGICYIGGVRNNPEEISELLNLPHHVIPLFGMTIGVPAEKNEVKPRLPIEAVLHDNSYDEEKYKGLLKAYDQKMHEYYSERNTNKKDMTWSRTMTEFLSTPRRPHMKDFVISKGFLQE